MRVTETAAVMLLAVKRDGTPGTGDKKTCFACGRCQVEFVASPGLREKVQRHIEERTIVCTNADLPCPMALKAKGVLDALKEACR